MKQCYNNFVEVMKMEEYPVKIVIKPPRWAVNLLFFVITLALVVVFALPTLVGIVKLPELSSPNEIATFLYETWLFWYEVYYQTLNLTKESVLKKETQRLS